MILFPRNIFITNNILKCTQNESNFCGIKLLSFTILRYLYWTFFYWFLSSYYCPSCLLHCFKVERVISYNTKKNIFRNIIFMKRCCCISTFKSSNKEKRRQNTIKSSFPSHWNWSKKNKKKHNFMYIVHKSK